MSKTNLEQIKAASRGLRGSLEEELANGEAFLSETGKQLIKFHGSYQQDDRDARRGGGGTRQYQFMIRCKLPGGQLSADQYVLHDDLASKYGNGTLRITTRQDFQLHGVIKGNLQSTIRKLNGALVTTFGACGDVVRNVTACPAPTSDPARRAVQELALGLSRETFPRTKAYHQIWLEGEPLLKDEEDELYGQVYLPRKFKVAIALPGDNCVDIYTHDVGLVAVLGESGGNSDSGNGGVLHGFNVLAGGGMGMTHNNAETYPRLADVIGFVGPDQAIETVKAIVTIHRDFGDRADRRHARLKYILQEHGVEWFRQELQSRLGFALQKPRRMPAFHMHDHLGWHRQDDGRLCLGIPVDSGRICNRTGCRMRDGLRTIIQRFNLSVRLTPQQNVMLPDVEAADRKAVAAVLAEHHIRTVDQISPVHRFALACPALPTCGLALAEGERAMPRVLEAIEGVLEELDLGAEPINVRMTGCPNGCARPYVAEIGIVGRSLDRYTIYLGGSVAGTRLNEPFLDLVPLDEIAPRLRPVFTLFRETRWESESFGDFCARIGVEDLRDLVCQTVGD